MKPLRSQDHFQMVKPEFREYFPSNTLESPPRLEPWFIAIIIMIFFALCYAFFVTVCQFAHYYRGKQSQEIFHFDEQVVLPEFSRSILTSDQNLQYTEPGTSTTVASPEYRSETPPPSYNQVGLSIQEEESPPSYETAVCNLNFRKVLLEIIAEHVNKSSTFNKPWLR